MDLECKQLLLPVVFKLHNLMLPHSNSLTFYQPNILPQNQLYNIHIIIIITIIEYSLFYEIFLDKLARLFKKMLDKISKKIFDF